VKAGEVAIIKLQKPERFSWVRENVLNNSRFSPKVWRIFLDIRYVNSIRLSIHDDFVRPPYKYEVPKLRWLAYGSSITYGTGAINNTNCYVQQAARRIGVDVLNLGLPGSCYCEKQVADFIAEREDWDFVTLEIGVNMRSDYSQEEFKNRVNYLLDKLTHNHPNKKFIILNIFPNHAIYSENGSIYEKDHLAFSNILKELTIKKSNKNLHLINGENILKDFSRLTVDLIHPSDFGHITMGENLAVILKDMLGL
jgi:lysophospholipase L1-like esterase